MRNNLKKISVNILKLVIFLACTGALTFILVHSENTYAWSVRKTTTKTGGDIDWKTISYNTITSFPINKSIFNSDKCYFCAQHGTPYASFGSTTNGTYHPEYGSGYSITRHQISWTSSRLADIPSNTNSIWYVDSNGTLHTPTINNSDFKGHKDSTETPSATTVTNWVYKEYTFTAHCNSSMKGWPSGVAHAQGGITDTGMAFILACFQGEGVRTVTYKNDPVQHAVWRWLGYGTESPYTNIASKFQSYHSAAYTTELAKIGFTPSTTDSSGNTTYAGTTINEDNTVYTVGPFTIDNYTRAKDYSGNISNLNETTIIEISVNDYNALPDTDKSEYSYDGNTGTYKLKNDANNGLATTQTLQDLLSSIDSSYVGDIIKIEGVLSNGTTEKTITLYDYYSSSLYQKNTVPNPKATNIYFNISAEDVAGYDELKSLKVTYRRVHSQLDGTYYDGIQYTVNWSEQSGSASDSGETYKCTVCSHTGIAESSASFKNSTHDYWCGNTGYCEHGWGSTHYACHNGGSNQYCNCNNEKNSGRVDVPAEYGYTPTGKSYLKKAAYYYYTTHSHTSSCNCNACSTPYCSHGHTDGKHGSGCKSWGASHIDQCSSKTVCESHGHEHCEHFIWTFSQGTDVAQNGLSMRGALVTQDWVWTTEVNVPLKTDMTIYKYISKVDHIGENINLYGGSSGSDSRKTKTDKSTDTLKIERGDLITYTVKIVNNSRFDTQIQVKDTFTNSSGTLVELVDANGDTCTITNFSLKGGEDGVDDSDIRNKAWITIPKNSTQTYIIKIRAIKDSGTYQNKIEFITGNHLSNKMRWTDADSSVGTHYGNIVNKAEIDGRQLQDSDYYTIKEYNVSIEKYIDSVSHKVSNGEYDNTMTSKDQRSRTNSDISEDVKIKNPVYVEYGDEITYKIVVYNTCETSTMVSSSNSSSPYYSPDKIYVDLEDTLPAKYSNLSITVASVNETGSTTHEVNYPSNGGSTFTIKDLMIPANSSRVITVKLTVEEYTRETTANNTVKFTGNVRNINYGPDARETSSKYYVVKNNANSAYVTSTDRYKINDYNARIDKYITGYSEELTTENNNTLKVTNETNSTSNIDKEARYSFTDKEKQEHPLIVEKNETLVYSIRVSNDATETENSNLATGTKYATQVRPTQVQDMMQVGLKYKGISATLYNEDGTVCTRYDEKGTVAVNIASDGTTKENNITYNIYNINLKDDTIILNPGEYIIYKVTVSVQESNMYLYNLENRATLNILTNVNDVIANPNAVVSKIIHSRIVMDSSHNENIAKKQTTSEYVKMKDLVISGKVWLDRDKDGIMDTINGSIDVDEHPSSNIQYDDDTSEKAFENITVNLYRVGTGTDGKDELIRTTKTDSTGLYTFGKDINKDWYSGTYTVTNNSTTESSQRIDKASNKDANKNYQSSSVYYQYYVEFVYDGILYKSTELYAGQDNLNNYGDLINSTYKVDSNAKELASVREKFNEEHETIAYNVSYDKTLETETDLDYTKDGHVSYLNIDQTRVMTSRSFIYEYDSSEIELAVKVAKKCGAGAWKSCTGKAYGVTHSDAWKVLINAGLLTEYQANNTQAGRETIQAMLDTILERAQASITASGDSQITNYLWLYDIGSDYNKPETEYLKYINLGLEEREDVDISIKKDVAQVITTINGEQVIYDFDQDSNGNYTISEPYTLELYESDYKYRIEQYQNQKVQDYKGTESELNIEVIFKIAITNEKISIDEPYRSGTEDIPIDVTINELADYYDENFMKYSGQDDESNEYQIKTKDGDYLVNKTVKIAEAWYNTSGDVLDKTKSLTLSNTSKYNEEKTSENYSNFAGYNTLYITDDHNDIKISEGNTGYVFIKYTLDKQDTITEQEKALINLSTSENLSRYLDIFDGEDNQNYDDTGDRYGIIEGITEISAYSTYYGTVSDSYKVANPTYVENAPAALVDKDSNAGNLGDEDKVNSQAAQHSEPVDNSSVYEDDTYRTGITFKINTITSVDSDGNTEANPDKTPDENEGQNNNGDGAYRTLTGFVWDDARTEAVTNDKNEETSDNEGTQYIGDGKYDTQKTKNSNAKSNSNVLTLIDKTDSNDYKSLLSTFNKNEENTLIAEYKDFKVKGAKAEIIEIVKIPDTDSDGNLTGTTRYYEETIEAKWPSVQSTRTDSSGSYKLSGYIPGYYIVRFSYGDETTSEMLTFNGQDYKSTTYTAGVENVTYTSSSDEQIKAYDNIMEALETENQSDARDDEITRLRTISYSEVMTNEKAETLKGISSESDTDKLVTETAMNAETVTFYVKPEKLDSIDTNTIDNADSNKAIRNASTYASRTNIPYNQIATRTYKIENIDFGIQYRPESDISLNKEIKSIQLVTSDSKTLMKIAFKDKINSDGTKSATYNTGTGTYRTERTIDIENSINFNNVQFVCNNYQDQGFVYINIDQDLLQGATILIEYEFTVENLSEIDRISTNLDSLRYKENTNNSIVKELSKPDTEQQVTVGYFDENGDLTKYSEPIVDVNNYVASDTAQKYMYSQVFSSDSNYGDDADYRIVEKTMTTGNDNYYGKYLGGIYYTGSISDTDTIVDTKIDKILDYVDTELDFKQSSNNSTDHKWTTTTSSALYNGDSINGGLIEKDMFTDVSNSGEYRLVNKNGVSYDNNLTSNLAVSVDDRTSDTDKDVINEGLSKFLEPKTIGTIETGNYKGNITLQIEKVISAEEDTENLRFENMAEIIQYTSTSGRRTNFATTIGDLKVGSDEYAASIEEKDASATEVITLSPPTGLNKVQSVLRNTASVTSNIVIVVVIILIVLAGGTAIPIIIKRYKNRPIK